MSASLWTEGSDLNTFADVALSLAARFWFVVAVAGQWMFAAYVIAFYGGAAARGNPAAWNEVLPNGYTPGHTLSNLAVAAHLVLAVVILVGGPLQFIPQLRSIAPSFHRWNGRVYVPAVVLTSIAGLYMIWSRGRADRLVQHTAVSLHAILIVCLALLAVHYALARDFRTHRRWALRLFMAISAAWFFRFGLIHRIFFDQRPIGFDPLTFTNPLFNFLAFADYLLPLAILEIYLRTKDNAGASGRLTMAAGIVVLTVAMGAGILAASRALWLPRM